MSPSVALCVMIGASAPAGIGTSVNTELIGQWDGHSGSYADVWGDGNIAYVGHFGDPGVHIIDISDPTSPVALAEYILPPPDDDASAQDVKVADGLLFIGVEGGSSSVHVVDVRDPANPLPLVVIDIKGYRSIHNIFFDNGYLYLADSNTTRVGIIDLTTLDPDDPPAGPITTTKWILENVGTSQVHDVTVQDGRLYASAWDSGLYIFDVTDVANTPPAFLGRTLDESENTHSAWATTNGDYVVTGEEFFGGGIKVYRIIDQGTSIVLSLTDRLELPVSQASSVHNQTLIGYRLYNSWYGAGLQVLDINPATGLLEFVASYDTASAWGVYPFLGPDRVLVSDISQGLMVFHVDPASGDVDGDGDVDAADLAVLLGSWGPCANCVADLNDDQTVDAADLALLLGNWGD